MENRRYSYAASIKAAAFHIQRLSLLVNPR